MARRRKTSNAGGCLGLVVGVMDGDIINVLDGRKTIKLHMEGIDAPESHQAYGTRARTALFGQVYGKQVRVERESWMARRLSSTNSHRRRRYPFSAEVAACGLTQARPMVN